MIGGPTRWAARLTRLCALLAAVATMVGARAPVAPPQVGAGHVPTGWPTPPAASADAYVLIDLATGQTLAARNPDQIRPVASTVKILTAVSVLRRSSLVERVTPGREVMGFAAGSAGVGLDPGETWTVADLLEGLLARSGNDAAAALAVHVGGSVPGFVRLMRADAAAFRLDGAVLRSPHGLGDANRMSARHLAVVARAALADPRFAAIAARPAVELPGVGAVPSRNELLGRYPGADGVKTGYTRTAGRCLVASARRGSRHLLVVVLGSDGRSGHFSDARRLLDHGFAGFATVPIAGRRPEVELKVAGGWVALDAPPTALLAPVKEPVLARHLRLPVDPGRNAVPLDVTWRGARVGRLQLKPKRLPTTAAAGRGGLGAWLANRAYAAMRAATDAGRWVAPTRR